MKQAPRIGRAIERAAAERAPDPPKEQPGTVRPDDKGAITRGVRARFRDVDWSLVVPGVHPGSGLEYDELLAVLKDQGRDFAADTAALDRYVLAKIQVAFEKLGRMPLMREIDESIGHAVLEWIVKRFAGTVRDVKLKRLTLAYAHRKKRLGFGDRPIGTATGALAHRVAEFGRVIVRKS